MLTPEQYIFKPRVDEEIERQQFSGAELLKRGTTALNCGQKSSSPLLAKRTKENDLKDVSQATSVNSANMQIDNSRYAMEGPHTTNISSSTYPRTKISLTHKDRIYVGNIEKEERGPSVHVESAAPTHTNSVRGTSNSNSLKFESKKSSDLVKVPQKSLSISICNEVERSLVKLKSCPPDNSKRDCDVTPGESVRHCVRGHVTPEKFNEIPLRWKSNILNTKRAEIDDRFTHPATSTTTEFDLNNPLSGDETNYSARTRVYHRKTNSRKHQIDLSPEKKIRKLCHDTAGHSEQKASKFGHQEHCCQLVNTPVLGKSLSSQRKELGKSLSSQRKEKKVCVSNPTPKKCTKHIHKELISRR